MDKELHKDVIVIGAGAAGFMAAIEAAKRGRKALLLDKAFKIGEKIRISGGGRCNFTNINANHENYISANPHFCKSALSMYTAHDFISLVESHEIKYHEKKLGQLFCDEGSEEIIDMLFNEARTNGVEIKNNCEVQKVEKLNTEKAFEERFSVKTKDANYNCNSLVIATGGLSIPQIGASDFAHRIAKQFELKVTNTEPALVPLTFKDPSFFEKLSGSSIDSIVSTNGTSFRENILFTHKGLSGPAILQISSYWKAGDKITINLLADLNLFEFLKKLSKQAGRKTIKSLLKGRLPEKFIDQWSKKHDYWKPIAEYSHNDFKKIAKSLQEWTLIPDGTEGYKKAEVTRGGVDTSELSSKTMESKKHPGLYFIGEAIDVTGWLGGYNFQWAWSSGFAAGQHC